MPTFSQALELHKLQPELDFVDVSLQRDNKLFLDPFAIAQELDRWSLNLREICKLHSHRILQNFIPADTHLRSRSRKNTFAQVIENTSSQGRIP
jgi:hypothetical protein